VVAHVGTAHGARWTSPSGSSRPRSGGRDAIAFSVFRASAFLTRRHPQLKELEAAELSAREWRKVLQAAKGSGSRGGGGLRHGLARLAAEAGVDAFQAHPTDLDHPISCGPRRAGVPRSRACGRGAARARGPRRRGARAALLVGPPLAPAAAEELGFPRSPPSGSGTACRSASSTRRRRVGLRSPRPALAAAHGADFVEKPIALDRARKARDRASALAPRTSTAWWSCSGRRSAAGRRESTPSARPPGPLHRGRGLIGRGEAITAEKLVFKRTDERFERGSPRGGAPDHRPAAARPIQADETIREDMLE